MKRLLLYPVVALAALLFAGCASIPARATSDDCLVVIKTVFENPDNLDRGRELIFNFSAGYPAAWVGQYSWDYNLVVVREPGVVLQSIGTKVQVSYRGEKSEHAIDVPLPYEPGRIAIADYVFVYRIEKSGERSMMSSMRFRDITDAEKDDLLALIASDPGFASWVQ
jgi:hypothetical protein